MHAYPATTATVCLAWRMLADFCVAAGGASLNPRTPLGCMVRLPCRTAAWRALQRRFVAVARQASSPSASSEFACMALSSIGAAPVRWYMSAVLRSSYAQTKLTIAHVFDLYWCLIIANVSAMVYNTS